MKNSFCNVIWSEALISITQLVPIHVRLIKFSSQKTNKLLLVEVVACSNFFIIISFLFITVAFIFSFLLVAILLDMIFVVVTMTLKILVSWSRFTSTFISILFVFASPLLSVTIISYHDEASGDLLLASSFNTALNNFQCHNTLGSTINEQGLKHFPRTR